MRSELDAARRDAGVKIEALRDELAQLRERLVATEQAAKVAAETHARELEQAKEAQEVARHDASEARESAAKLAGQLEAVQAQNAALLAAVQQRSDRGSGGK